MLPNIYMIANWEQVVDRMEAWQSEVEFDHPDDRTYSVALLSQVVPDLLVERILRQRGQHVRLDSSEVLVLREIGCEPFLSNQLEIEFP